MNYRVEIVNLPASSPFLLYSTGVIETIPHLHDEIEILFLLNGSLNYSVGTESGTLKKGGMLLINSMTPHAFNTVSVCYCLFLQCNVEMLGFSTQNEYYYDFDIKVEDESSYSPRERRILERFLQLAQLQYSGKRNADMYIYSLVHLMFADIFTLFDHVTTKVRTHYDQSSNHLTKILRYIDQHYAEPITLKTLSEVTFISPTYLAHYFKNCIGLTIGDYLMNVRIMHAKHLLLFSGDSILAVAIACGYQDSSSFCRAFRRHTGQSPQQYRKSTALNKFSNNAKMDERRFDTTQTGLYLSALPAECKEWIDDALLIHGFSSF